MKFNFFSLILILTISRSIAQENRDGAFYIDSLGAISTEMNYKYVRVVKDYYLNQKIYDFSDYYKSGKIAVKGKTKDRDILRFEGTRISYYENGNKKQISNYVDSHLIGKQYQWHENGVLQFEKEYSFDEIKKESIEKLNQYWDQNNVQQIIDGNGNFEALLENFSEGRENKDLIFEKGAYKNGLKDGFWTGNSLHPKITFKEEYNNGKLILGTSTNEDNIQFSYTEIMQKAIPKKGINYFYQYIGRNFRTPKIAGLSGKIYLSFVVNTDGKLVEPKVLRDIGFETGTEALRLINEAKNWIPGKIRGIPVRILYSLPITVQSQ